MLRPCVTNFLPKEPRPASSDDSFAKTFMDREREREREADRERERERRERERELKGYVHVHVDAWRVLGICASAFGIQV